MRYSDMRDMIHERAALLDKKRLGKNQKARLATLSEKLDSATQPPATPPRANTGERADFQGNVYEMQPTGNLKGDNTIWKSWDRIIRVSSTPERGM